MEAFIQVEGVGNEFPVSSEYKENQTVAVGIFMSSLQDLIDPSLMLIMCVQKVTRTQVPAVQEPIATPLDSKDIHENDAPKSNEEVLKESIPASTTSPTRSSPKQCLNETVPDPLSPARCSPEHQSQSVSNSGKCYLNGLNTFLESFLPFWKSVLNLILLGYAVFWSGR